MDFFFNRQREPIGAMLRLAASPFLGVSISLCHLPGAHCCCPSSELFKEKPAGASQMMTTSLFDVPTPRCVSNAVSQAFP